MTKNAFIFDGSNNTMEQYRQLVTDWICNFVMRWYPFGTQKCDMIFYVTEEIIELEPDIIEYRGKMSKYFNY